MQRFPLILSALVLFSVVAPWSLPRIPSQQPIPVRSRPIESRNTWKKTSALPKSRPPPRGRNRWVSRIGWARWHLSLCPPFFGVTCLSGLAIWGPEWVTDNALLGASGPLQSETLFFIFLALALRTSLPRLTKVSKPFAQAVDRLETYAVIIILLVIKLGTSLETSGETEVAVVQLGVLSFTADTLWRWQ